MIPSLEIVGALIGLTGAINNNGKTATTDQVVIDALLSQDPDAAIARIHAEKFTISPNCASCPTPCGNTSDKDMSDFFFQDPALRTAKEALINRLAEIASATRIGTDTSMPDEGANPESTTNLLPQLSNTVYEALACLGYDLTVETYTELLETLSK